MPKPREGSVNVSVTVDDALRRRIGVQATRLGVGWTTALKILARERLEQIEKGD